MYIPVRMSFMLNLVNWFGIIAWPIAKRERNIDTSAALTDYTLDSKDAREQEDEDAKEEVGGNATHETAIKDEVNALSGEASMAKNTTLVLGRGLPTNPQMMTTFRQLSETAVDVSVPLGVEWARWAPSSPALNVVHPLSDMRTLWIRRELTRSS